MIRIMDDKTNPRHLTKPSNVINRVADSSLPEDILQNENLHHWKIYINSTTWQSDQERELKTHEIE